MVGGLFLYGYAPRIAWISCCWSSRPTAGAAASRSQGLIDGRRRRSQRLRRQSESFAPDMSAELKREAIAVGMPFQDAKGKTDAELQEFISNGFAITTALSSSPTKKRSTTSFLARGSSRNGLGNGVVGSTDNSGSISSSTLGLPGHESAHPGRLTGLMALADRAIGTASAGREVERGQTAAQAGRNDNVLPQGGAEGPR